MSDTTPDLELDLRGLACPMPIVKMAQNMGSVPIGGLVRAVATDRAAKADFPAWAKSTGHELVSIEDVDDGIAFLVRRTK